MYNNRELAKKLVEIGSPVSVVPGTLLSSFDYYRLLNEGNLFSEPTVKELSNTLASEIRFIRDHINPEIRAGIKDIKQEGDRILNATSESEILIKKVTIPSFITEYKDRGKLTYNKELITLSNTPSNIPKPSDEDLIKLLDVGTGRMNMMVKEFTSTLSKEDIDRVWDSYITGISNNTVMLNISTGDSEHVNDIYVLYLFCTSLIEKGSDYITVPYSKYDYNIKALKNRISIIINRRITYYENEIKQNIIIRTVRKGIIFVNGMVYDEYAKDNRDELLIATHFTSPDMAYTINNITSNAENIMNKWNSAKALERVKKQNNLSNMYRAIYNRYFTDYLKQLPDVLDRNIPAERKSLLQREISDYLKSSDNLKMLDVPLVLADIVGGIMFKHTNAREFFGYMDMYNKDVNLSKEEAAKYAAMELTLDYLLNQVELIKQH